MRIFASIITFLMKKILLLVPVALLLLGCNQTKGPKAPTPEVKPADTAVVPATDSTPSEPELTVVMNPDSKVNLEEPSNTIVVRDTTAPLGSPQNPLKVEPGKPLDIAALLRTNNDPKTFAENVVAHIDSVSKLAEVGDINAMFLYGSCFEQGLGVRQDYGKAYEWYKKAADHGQKNAFGAIGGLYRVGHGVPVDNKQAFEWFKKGAELKDNNAMLCLGNCYYMGLGVEKNLEEAAFWWEKAADGGSGFALSQMGDAYYGGLGVEKDLDKAVEYYTQAVDKGIPNALYRLGVLYYYGQGVEQDTVYAKLLVTKARDRGVEQAEAFYRKHF